MKRISFETLQGLGKRDKGLSEKEVNLQTSKFGKNEISEVAENLPIELLKDTLKDPMIWFLLGIGGVFLFVGQNADAALLFVAIIPLVLMDSLLHWRAKSATSGLKKQLSFRVRVFRNSSEVSLDSKELVPGDLVVITPDLLLPADGIFQQSEGLQIDESILTGEAFPIQKQRFLHDPFELAQSGEIVVNPEAFGYAGTRVLTGKGLLRVLFTGKSTAYGEVIQSVAAIPQEKTPLQKAIAKLVEGLVFAAAVFCVLLAGVRMYQGYGWLDALLSAATLAVAALPEEFPVVFTFFLGVGVYRLAKKHALVRRAVSIENIGRVTYICSDKTGTITIGRLKLTHLDPVEGLSEDDLLKVCLASSDPNGSDPVDIAIRELSSQKGLPAPNRLRVFPFTEDRKRETVFELDENGFAFAYMKGAPETILAQSSFSEADQKRWLEKTKTWAREGHKVLACAKKNITQEEVHSNLEPENDFQFCGLLAFEDPPRPEVAEAIRYCNNNAVRVLMLTGDHPDTAVAIAREIGLGNSMPQVFSAENEPEKIEDEWLAKNPKFLTSLDVVARCKPLQKLRIVNALKKSGELVAVTGDGVNDVPALKAADVGISMGQRGTRSAKEVSSIILADDNFKTIVSAITEGKQLFANLKMSFEYLLLIHIPLVLTAALMPLLGYPILYLPIHIVWLELVIHPTALLAFQSQVQTEGAAKEIKSTPQKDFFSKSEIIRIVFTGVGLAAALGLSFASALSENLDIGHARAVGLAILTVWSAILVCYLTRLRTRTSLVVAFATLSTSVLLIQVPSLGEFVYLSPLHFTDWMSIVGIILAFIFFGPARGLPLLNLNFRIFRKD